MKISYGNSRHETKWKSNEISWEDFKKRVSTTVRTPFCTFLFSHLHLVQQAFRGSSSDTVLRANSLRRNWTRSTTSQHNIHGSTASQAVKAASDEAPSAALTACESCEIEHVRGM